MVSEPDPWGYSMESTGGPIANMKLSMDSGTATQHFEDNFIESHIQSIEGNYVALDDSSAYLDRLQQKLDRVQGNSATPSSRSLLDGLMAARHSHHHQLLSSMREDNARLTEGISTEQGPDSLPSDLPHTRGVLLPGQHHLHSLLLKMAPDRMALSADELVHLLSADVLDFQQITTGEIDRRQKTVQEVQNTKMKDAASEEQE
ncbi:uncharacterized protein LOC108675787 isoform X2 [Hyalella azteca]|uniref:Uncharacterized protein LOC108675787 isoform X2 n=1 Tax=Hyalella azteca TaxID=294128 RepID=A0A8B7NZP6_HYAAZ|nr:uncharacterized protein LOC108675787 isoform X2 [Hyalella azteca]